MELLTPYDIPAERALLASLLQLREAILTVAHWLRPTDFYLEKHGHVYEAVLACYARREPPDLFTVCAELRSKERLDSVGGMDFMTHLAVEHATAYHAEHYARIVQTTARRRRLIETGGKITALAYDEQRPIAETFDRAERLLFDVTQANDRGRDWHPMQAIADEVYSALQKMVDGDRSAGGIPSGYPDLDALAGGWFKSDLTILAGRPGMGKTSLMLCLAYQAARAGRRVGIFSIEMSRQQLMQRMVSLHTGISAHALRTGLLDADQLSKVAHALGYLAQLPIEIEDTPGIPLAELRSKARRLVADAPVDLLMIDYLGKIRAPGERDRLQEVSAIARALKDLARELDVPVLTLAQMNRSVESRADREPQLSDLRDSGEIEQEADAVWFIWRDKDHPAQAKIIIEKHRHGPLGAVPLRFDEITTRFYSVGPRAIRMAGD